MRIPRPVPPADLADVADGGVAQERTALAWERTSISMMGTGVLLSRFAATDHHPFIAGAGVAQAVVGALVLMWAGLHYTELHGPVREGGAVVHPYAARALGLGTVVFSGIAFVLAVLYMTG